MTPPPTRGGGTGAESFCPPSAVVRGGSRPPPGLRLWPCQLTPSRDSVVSAVFTASRQARSGFLPSDSTLVSSWKNGVLAVSSYGLK